MGEGNNFASVCPSIHSGVPTLAGGTYPALVTYLCWGYPPWQEGRYLPWLGDTYPGLEVPTLTSEGTYLG